MVAVTGSAGKTSTKDILAALLAPVARVVATSGNHNNEIGVPLTVFELEPQTEVLVCELAMRGRGQIAELAAIVKPDVGGHHRHPRRCTSSRSARSSRGSPPRPRSSPRSARAPWWCRPMRPCSSPICATTRAAWSLSAAREPTCRGRGPGAGFGTHTLIDAFGRRAAFEFNFSGGHYLRDALAAIGAFIALGYNLEEAKAGAAAVEFSALRGRLTDLPGGGLLLNDSYNANPVSMKAAIDHLCQVAGERPRVAVLGDMFELGSGAAAFHREVGQHADVKGVRVLAVGALARDYLTGQAARGTRRSRNAWRRCRGRSLPAAPCWSRPRARCASSASLRPSTTPASPASRRSSPLGRAVCHAAGRLGRRLRIGRTPLMFTALAAGITSMVVMLIVGPWFIEWLRRNESARPSARAPRVTRPKRARRPWAAC